MALSNEFLRVHLKIILKIHTVKIHLYQAWWISAKHCSFQQTEQFLHKIYYQMKVFQI